MKIEHVLFKVSFLEDLKQLAGGMTEDCPKPILTAISVVNGSKEPYADVKAAYGWFSTFADAVKKAGGTPDQLLYGVLDDLKAAAEAA